MRYRDLLSAALAGDILPMTPVSAWRHHPILDQESDTLAAATLAYQARFDVDWVKITPASTWQSRDHGLMDRWANDRIGRREITATVIKTAEDWPRLRYLPPWDDFSGRMLRAVRTVRQALDPAIPVLATVFNPLFQAIQLAGLDVVRQHAQAHRPALEQGLAILRANTLAVIEQLLELRIDGVFFASQHAGRGLLAPHAYANLALSDDHACLDAAAPLPFNFLHLHGPEIDWALFRDLDSALIHYDAAERNPAPLALATQLAGGLATGPHPQGAILHGTTDILMADVLALRRAMQGQRFLLAPGCALPLAVPEHQVDALIQAARAPLTETHPS